MLLGGVSKHSVGLEDDAVGKMLATQAWRLEFEPQDPHYFEKPGMVVHASDPSTEKIKDRWVPGAHWPASLEYLVRDPVSKNK